MRREIQIARRQDEAVRLARGNQSGRLVIQFALYSIDVILNFFR